MALTKLYQVLDAYTAKVRKHFKTQEECEKYLSPDGKFAKDIADLMGTATYTIRPIWTNANERSIKELLKK